VLCACGGGLGLETPPPFPQPPVWGWTPGFGWLENGAPTSDTLVCRVAPNLIQGDLVRTPTYNGRLTGPTLRIRPGDTFHLDICNRFPDNPPAQRAGPMGAFPHDPFTTNFHTHGLTTDPGGISDNVLRHMEPGTRSPVEVCIPAYHPAGTMWYHPHKHGSVSYQLFGGMAGFLIVQGGPGTLDDLPAVQAAREVVMAFQGIQVDVQGTVPWVNTAATAFAGGPNGLWAPFEGSTLYATTNGVVNPQLVMRPGEVQRWRWLNAFSGHTLCLELEGHDLHVVAQDGLTVPAAMTVPAGMSYVLGAGNRADVMVRAGAPGTYVLRAVDPLLTPKSISAQGVAPGERRARIGGSFPPVSYPLDLVTVRVEGTPVAMDLPSGSLPVAPDLGTECVLDATPSVTRHVEFEICPDPGNELDPYLQAICDVYRPRYGAGFWGGTPFNNLLMMLDRDDHGLWQKAGLFTPGRPLFGYPGDVPMFGGAIEEWVVSNRTASDHPFHIHVNPFLVTHVNGVALPEPEWRDTVLVPARFEDANGDMADGSVRFRTHYDPNFFGVFVMHCHILTHEDVGMMQEVEIVPGRGDRCPPHPFACTPADPFILVPQPCGDEPGPVR
jgi:FtsP/CotA-like multicopper oxidase with cupredoxin domain